MLVSKGCRWHFHGHKAPVTEHISDNVGKIRAVCGDDLLVVMVVVGGGGLDLFVVMGGGQTHRHTLIDTREL